MPASYTIWRWMLPWFVDGLLRRGIFLLPQHVLHRRGRLTPKARYYVGVGIEGRRDVSVTKKLLDELGMHPLGEKEAHTSVPEIMEGNLGSLAFLSRGRQDRLVRLWQLTGVPFREDPLPLAVSLPVLP